MQQHNLGPVYFTKRNVIRRPVFVSTSSTPQEEDITPWHWPKEVSLEGGRLDVEPTKKQQISQQFKTSLARNVTVLDVEEICNAEFYQKYQSKKKILAKKLGENNVNELELYHGTDATVVDGICKQNFDWRLNGKNATMFGQGSYFATQASYSLNFTRPDSNKIRYMFVAKVLAGRYTKGSSDIKRPPPISPLDPHTLHDSCVDNISSPSMYIVFERDQCYPQYLITFLEDNENLALRGNRYSVDFDQSALRRQKQAINSLSYKHKLKPLNERPRRSYAAASNASTLTEDSSYSTSTNRPSYTTSSHQPTYGISSTTPIDLNASNTPSWQHLPNRNHSSSGPTRQTPITTATQRASTLIHASSNNFNRQTSPTYSNAQTQPKANKKDGCIIS
ncbi:protein mono-ADP-ribosyltransferase PARP11-like [Clytia hemisphaerica]